MDLKISRIADKNQKQRITLQLGKYFSSESSDFP